MLTVAIIVERFSNTRHTHVQTDPPRVRTWRSLPHLLFALAAQYGHVVSLHYRDLGDQPAVPIGWVLNEDTPAGVLETWVAVCDPETLKYQDLRTLGDGDASEE